MDSQSTIALIGMILGGLVAFVVWLVVMIAVVGGVWKAFAKAGKPGWASLVPIYNTIVLLDIVHKPIWWFLLLCIPIVNAIVAIIVIFSVARVYGRSGLFGLGLLVLPVVFWPILGWGSSRYVG